MPMRFLFVDNDIEYEMEYVCTDSLDGWLEYKKKFVSIIFINRLQYDYCKRFFGKTFWLV